MNEDRETRLGAAGRLRAYLELFRLPNVFTAIADVLMGFLLLHASFEPWAPLALLVIASGLLYMAGMVLNDVFDLEIDARDRPGRPLPSGRIDPGFAKLLGCELMLVGVAAGWLAAWLVGCWAPGIVATALAAAVWLYDAWLKRTPLGPLGMGSCRFLNVLLGTSAAAAMWHVMHWIVAAGIGLYIVGVTWFARTEARRSARPQLAAALGVILAGLALLTSFPWWADETLAQLSMPVYAQQAPWLWLMVALAAIIAIRCALAVIDPQPLRVQTAVKQCILSLIMLDAAVCLAVRGPTYALVILLLLVPATFLGRWIYST